MRSLESTWWRTRCQTWSVWMTTSRGTAGGSNLPTKVNKTSRRISTSCTGLTTSRSFSTSWARAIQVIIKIMNTPLLASPIQSVMPPHWSSRWGSRGNTIRLKDFNYPQMTKIFSHNNKVCSRLKNRSRGGRLAHRYNSCNYTMILSYRCPLVRINLNPKEIVQTCLKIN